MATKVIVNVLLKSGSEVGLVQYPDMPDQQSGFMIASAIVPEGGDVEGAARDIVQTHFDGLMQGQCKLFAAESFIGRDGTWHVAISYFVESSKESIRAKDAVKRMEWISADAVTSFELAHPGWTRSLIRKAMSS